MARRTFSSIFQSMFGSVSAKKNKIPRRANLLLEQMEDRTTPATVSFAGNTLTIAYAPGDIATFTTTAADTVNITFNNLLINGGTAGSGLAFAFGPAGTITGLLTAPIPTIQINIIGDVLPGDKVIIGAYDGFAAGISTDANVDLVDIIGPTKTAILSVGGASNLGANITTLGFQAYSGPSMLTASVGLDSLGSSIQFGSLFDGNGFDLALGAGIGAGTTNFVGPVSNLGSGTGAALSVASTGLVRFQSTVAGNSGLVAGPGSNLQFDDNVSLANGNTATNLAGNVQLDGLAFSGFDGITMNNVSLSGSSASLDSNGSAITLGTITGSQNLILSAGIGIGTTTVTGSVSGLGSGAGAALAVTTGVTGLVEFQGKVTANSGVVSGLLSTVQFDDDVTLGNGDTASNFAGTLQLDGLIFSAFDGLTANNIGLSTGAVTVQASAGDITIGTIDGAQTIDLDAGSTNDIMVMGAIGSKSLPAGLTITNSSSTYFFDTVDVNGAIQLNNTTNSIGFGLNVTANSINTAANPFSVSMTGSIITVSGSSIFNNSRTVVLGNAPTDTLLFSGGLDVVSISPPFATSISGSIISNGSPIHLDNVLLTSDSTIDTTNAGAAPVGAPLSITSGVNLAGYTLTTRTGPANTTALTGPLAITSGELIAASGDLDLGTAIAGAAITVSGNTLIQAKSGKLTVGALSTIAAGLNNLTLQSDDIFINSGPGSITSAADVALAPVTLNRDIYFGAAAATLLPGVKVSQASINAINAGRLLIGQNGGSGLVTLGTATVADPLAIIANGGGGKVSVTGTLTSTVASPSVYPAVFIDGSGSTTVLGANILTAGVPVVINDSVQVNAALVVIDTSFGVPAGANVDITGGSAGIFATLGSTNDLTVLAGTTGVVTLGALMGFGTGGTGSLVDDLNVTAASIVLPTADTVNGNMNLTAPTISVGATLTAGASLSLTGAVTLTGVSTLSGDGITVTGTIDADGNNLVLDGKSGAAISGAINITGTITNGAALSVQDSTGATFSGAVTAQSLAINANNTGTVAFNNNLNLAGGISAGAGAYALNLVGSTVFVGGPVSFLNLGTLTLGNNDLDSITVTSGMTRFSPTLLQGVQSFGGPVILNQASATNAGGNLTLGVDSLNLGFPPGGLAFGTLSILASGAVVATAGTILSGTLSINAGSISQSGGIWSTTGTATLTASGDITLNAANSFPAAITFSGANVSINNIAPITLIGGNTATGTLSLTTPSPIGINQLPGSTVNITGGTTLTAAGAPIILNQPGNFFTGPVGFNGSNVVLVGTGPMALAASLATGTLNVTAGGAITDTGALLVALSGTFAAGATNDITLDNANNFGSVGIFSGNNVTINNTGILGLDTSTISGTLNVTANGAITDNGGLTVAGAAKFTAGAANNITLNDVANNFLSVGIVSGNNVVLNDINALALDTSTISGTLGVTTTGAITDIGALTVAGASTFSAGAGNNITLDNANNFSSVGVSTGNNVVLNDINALTLDAITITGTLTVTTNGPITDNAALSVAGAATFSAGSANDITLDNLNNFTSVSIGSGRNVVLNDTNAIGLNASTISGTLGVTANGAITDNGALIVAGAASFAAGAANNITLDNANNFLSVGIVSGLNIVLNDINALALDASTISGTLGVMANGAITDNGALLVTGAATFAAGAGNDVTLDNANNFLSVGITSGRNVLLNDINALALNASTISGTLSVTANGAITDNGALLVSGAATFAAGAANDITLNNANDFSSVGISSGRNVTLNDINAIALNTSTISGTLNLTAGGPVTQTGNLIVSGSTTLSAFGNDITLGLANQFLGGVQFTGLNVLLNDSGSLNLIAPSLATTNLTATASGVLSDSGPGVITVGGLASLAGSNIGLLLLNALGTVAINTPGNASINNAAGINLAASSISGTLALIANTGNITDTALVTVGGNAQFSTFQVDADILLDQTIITGTVQFSTQGTTGNVLYGTAAPISLGGSLISGNMTLTTSSTITQSAAITVTGSSSLTGSDIGLSNPANAFTGPVDFNGNNVNLAGGGTLVVGPGTANGNLVLSAGALAQAGSLGVLGVSSLTSLAGAITLADLTNTFTGPLTITSAGNATINADNGLVLNNSNITGAFNSTSIGMDQVIGASLFVGGASTIDVSPLGDIILDNGSNDFVGSVGFNARNVLLTDINAIILGPGTSTGDFDVQAVGISQGGILAIAGASSLNSPAGNITLANPGNTFSGVVDFTGINVSLASAGALIVGPGTASGSMTLSAASLGQAGSLNVVGASSLTSLIGAINFSDPTNTFTGPIAVTSAGNAALNADNLLIFNTSAITGSLAISAIGIDQVAATTLSVTGISTLDVTPTGDIILNNLGNDFGGSVGFNARDVMLADANAIILGPGTAAGILNVQGVNITQSAPLAIAGTTTLNSPLGNITLADPANSFIGDVAFTGINVQLTDVVALKLAASTATGNLILTGNSISQTGILSVTGTSTLSAPGQDITLTLANNFVGSVGFTARDVSLTDTNAIILGPGTATGILAIQAVGITQSAALSISGTSALTSPGGNITLADPTNVFTGQVAFSGINVQLSDASALILAASTATGTLDLVGNGITQTGALTVTGNTTLTATGQDINLDLANSFGGTIGFTAANVSINDITATALTAGTATGTFDLVSGGSVTQFASKLTIAGATTVTASGNITLDAVANAMAGGLAVQGVNVTIANSIDLAVSGKATGNLVANVTGDITDQAALSVAGTASFDTTGASNGINLDQLSSVGLITANTADGDATIVNSSAISFAGIVSGIYSLTALAGGISDGGATDASGGFILAAPGSSFLVQALAGPGGLIFNGTGTLTVSGINTFTGATSINSGVLILTGSLGSSDVTVAGGALRGEGDMASLTATGGTVRPGQSPGIFTSAGPANMGAGSAFVVEIDGKLAGTGYSQIVASDVVLGSTLGLTKTVAYTPMIGDRFTIVDNTGLNPVTGIFAGYPEGSYVPLGSQLYAITYKGGADANDVVLIAVSTIPTPTGPVITAPFSLAAGYTAVNIGKGTIDLINPAKSVRAIQPFPGYLGDLAVNAMDRNGDGKADSLLVAVASAGAVPHVMVIDAATGRVALSFYAFDPGFLGGLSISSGLANIGGVNKSVITVGAGAGAQPSVSVFNSVTGQFIKQFYAFAEEYRGGVNVAMSVPDSMGHSIVVVGAKTVDHIVTFDLNHTDNPESSFFAFGGGVAGVNISVADIDLGGLNEIVAGVGPGGEPRVSIFRSTGTFMDSFLAYAPGFLGGVNVAISDANADGQYDILTGSAAGTPGTLAGFAYPALNLVDAAFLTDYDTWLFPATNLTL